MFQLLLITDKPTFNAANQRRLRANAFPLYSVDRAVWNHIKNWRPFSICIWSSHSMWSVGATRVHPQSACTKATNQLRTCEL